MSLKAKFICAHWIDDNAVRTGESFEFDISRIVRDMSDAQRQKLIAEVDKLHSQNLDFLAELADVIKLHNGPFTVELDDIALADFIEAGMPVPSRRIAYVAIAFDDPENDIGDTSDLATWVDAAMGGGGRNLSATVYANASDLQQAIAAGNDPFKDDRLEGAMEVPRVQDVGLKPR